MQAHLLKASIAVATFTIGLAGTHFVNSAADSLVDLYETACNLDVSTVLWNEPVPGAPRASSCRLIVITVKEDRELFLNSEQIGTLDSRDELLDRLAEVFRLREQHHVYRDRIEATSHLPEGERIDKSVFLKAERSLNFGEVYDLIEALRKEGANPIGLFSDRSPASSAAGR